MKELHVQRGSMTEGNNITTPDSNSENNSGNVDESGFEKEHDSGPAEIEVPFDPTKIDIIVKPMTISSLLDRIKNAELDLTPEFQRQANIWNAQRKSRLIESILLRIPLPSFYFSEDNDGVYAVVDGLQRLCAIFHFIACNELNKATGAKLNPLRLEGLQYLKELDDDSFSDMDRKFQRRITELEITANIIRANTPPAVKFNVFARLNQGGMPLNAQEIRNAIFPGKWRSYIGRMAESKVFLKATEKRIHTERQQDMELVLRFVALWQIGRESSFRRPTNQTLDEFLNNTVEKVLLHWPSSKWAAVETVFERAIDASRKVFGPHAFRKSSGDKWRTPINRGLFEAQLIVLGELSDDHLKVIIRRKENLVERFTTALSSNSDFSRALLYATGSAEASNTRINTLRAIVKEVIDA